MTTDPDLLAAGYALLSRALAAEAEVGRLKAERETLRVATARMCAAARMDGAAFGNTLMSNIQHCEDLSNPMTYVRVAPPSPPVAPEPAQVGQQEQAEREATELRETINTLGNANERLAMQKAAAESDRDAERAQKEAVEVRVVELTNALKCALSQLSVLGYSVKARIISNGCGGIDYIDLSKYEQPTEAAPVPVWTQPELDAVEAEGAELYRKLGNHGTAPVAKVEAPSEPQEETRDCPSCGHQRIAGYSRCPNVDCLRDLTEAPSEPVAWVPKVGATSSTGDGEVAFAEKHADLNRGADRFEANRDPDDRSGRDCMNIRDGFISGYNAACDLLTDKLVDAGQEILQLRARLNRDVLCALDKLEPAPQPPATTGGAEWAEEANSALDRFLKEPHAPSEAALYDAIRWVLAGLRDELERRKP